MAQEMTAQLEEQIRTRAYYLWEADGRPQGRDWDYWMKAKQELEPKSESLVAPAMTPSRKKSVNSEPRTAAPATPKRRTTRTAVYA